MIEHRINGDKYTTYFDFTYSLVGNTLTISKGEYYANNQLITELAEDFIIELETGKEYNFALVDGSILVFHEFIDGLTYVDLLAWGTIEEMHVKTMI